MNTQFTRITSITRILKHVVKVKAVTASREMTDESHYGLYMAKYF